MHNVVEKVCYDENLFDFFNTLAKKCLFLGVLCYIFLEKRIFWFICRPRLVMNRVETNTSKSIRILNRIFNTCKYRIFQEECSLFTNIFEYFRKVFEYLLKYAIFVNIRILEHPNTFKKKIRFFPKKAFRKRSDFLGKNSVVGLIKLIITFLTPKSSNFQTFWSTSFSFWPLIQYGLNGVVVSNADY
jgi:hypothetical protein